MSYHDHRPRWERPPAPKKERSAVRAVLPVPGGPKVGDLVRMRFSERGWEDARPYWCAGAIGRLMCKFDPTPGWGEEQPTWQITFDHCGNPEGSFQSNPEGWRGYRATSEDRFTLWAKKGGPDDCFVQPG